MSSEVEQILKTAHPRVRDLARRTRTLIKTVLPKVVEVPWPNDKAIGYGVGPKKGSEIFGWLGVYTAHVTLGFYYGVELPDPNHLLEGTGKRLRHIKITTPEQLDNPAVRQLLALASRQVPRLKSKDDGK